MVMDDALGSPGEVGCDNEADRRATERRAVVSKTITEADERRVGFLDV